MSVVTKVVRAPIGAVAFLAMLFLSSLRGLYIVVFAVIRRIFPANMSGWAVVASVFVAAALLVLRQEASDRGVFVDPLAKIIDVTLGVTVTLIGAAATIREAYRSIGSSRQAEKTTEQRPAME